MVQVKLNRFCKWDAREVYRKEFFYEHIHALYSSMLCSHTLGRKEESNDGELRIRCTDCGFVNVAGGLALFLPVEVLPKLEDLNAYPLYLQVGSGH